MMSAVSVESAELGEEDELFCSVPYDHDVNELSAEDDESSAEDDDSDVNELSAEDDESSSEDDEKQAEIVDEDDEKRDPLQDLFSMMDGQKVHIIVVDGMPWFRAIDALLGLKYKRNRKGELNASKITESLKNHKEKSPQKYMFWQLCELVAKASNPDMKPSEIIRAREELIDARLSVLFGRKRNRENVRKCLYINESGFYEIASRRNRLEEKDATDRYRSWLFDIVLPSIRKHKYYVSPTFGLTPEQIAAALEKAKQTEQKCQHMAIELAKKGKALVRTKRSLKQEKQRNKHMKAEYKRMQEQMASFITHVKPKATKTQYVYIVANDINATNKCFKYGGVASQELLKKRLISYNVGKPRSQHMKYVFIRETYNYKLIEKVIQAALPDIFVAGGSETVFCDLKVLFDFLEHTVKCVNNAIAYITLKLKEIAQATLVDDPIQPVYLELSSASRAEPATSMIELSSLPEAEQLQLLHKTFTKFMQSIVPAVDKVHRAQFAAFVKRQGYAAKANLLWRLYKKMADEKTYALKLTYYKS